MHNLPNLTKIPLDYNNTNLFAHKHYGIFLQVLKVFIDIRKNTNLLNALLLKNSCRIPENHGNIYQQLLY